MLKKVASTSKKFLHKVSAKLKKNPPQIIHDKNLWQDKAQEGEFVFHLKNKWRQTDDFMNQTIGLFSSFGFTTTDFSGKMIMDLGCGSKLRTNYFTGAKIIAVEPLASRFMGDIEWCDLKDAHKVFSVPAEELIEECVGKLDLVMSINVLDHCYNFIQIVDNVKAYMKDDGLAFLSFDKHTKADQLHPLELNEEICEAIFAEKGLIIEKQSIGGGKVLKTYGHGDYCLNYWLRKK